MGNQNWGHLTIGGSMGWAHAAKAPPPLLPKHTRKKNWTQKSTPEHPDWADELIRHLCLMLKHTPSIWCQKPPHYGQSLVRVLKRHAWQNQTNLGKEILFYCKEQCLIFYIISRSIWDHCPISSWISKTYFCMHLDVVNKISRPSAVELYLSVP